MKKVAKQVLLLLLIALTLGTLAACSKTMYVVHFETNGGDPLPDFNFMLKEHRFYINDIVPEKECYIFEGWYFDKELTKKAESNISTDQVSGDFTLYAKWREMLFLMPDNTYALLDIGKDATEFTIPDFFNGLPVTRIASAGKNKIASITIPATVTYIKKSAFSGVKNLKSITFAEGCALEVIERYAFQGLTDLTEIALPPTEVIGSYAFQNCTALKKVTLQGNTVVNYSVFNGCNAIEDVQLDNTSINVQSNFKDSVWYKNLGQQGVLYSKDTAIGYAGAAPEDGVIRVKDGTKYIAPGAFQTLTGVTEIILPEGLLDIGASAFSGTKLTKLTLPDSLLHLGNYVFDSTGLNTVIDKAPPNLKTVGEEVFKNFSNITEIPEGTLEDVCGSSFLGTGWQDAQPAGVVYVGKTAVGYNGDEEKIANLVIKEGTERIASGAFFEKKITKLTLPSTLKTIGQQAFLGCGLRQVAIPDGVVKIESGCFRNNTLYDLSLPDSLKEIGSEAFLENNLNTVTLPEQLISIGTSAFGRNYGLDEIFIPKSVIFAEDIVAGRSPLVYYQCLLRFEANEGNPFAKRQTDCELRYGQQK